MTRRSRTRGRRRQKPPNRWLLVIQLLVLSGLLVFLVLFRDYIATSASSAVDTFTSSDLEVQAADAGAATGTDKRTNRDSGTGSAPSSDQ